MTNQKLSKEGDIITFPKGQTVALTYYPDSKKQKYYIVTQDKYSTYYLYLVENGKPKKLKSSEDPTTFKEIYPERR